MLHANNSDHPKHIKKLNVAQRHHDGTQMTQTLKLLSLWWIAFSLTNTIATTAQKGVNLNLSHAI